MSDPVEDLLNKRATEIERPLNLPEGEWVMEVSGVPTLADTAKGNHKMYTVIATPVEPHNNVDDGLLKEYDDRYQRSNHRLYLRMLIRKDTEDQRGIEGDIARVKSFMEACGGDDDQSLAEFMSGPVNGCRFVGEVTYRNMEGDDRLLEEVSRWWPV